MSLDPCAPKKAKLDEAESAYHDLMTGRAVRVLVDQNGERVEYQTSNRGALATYIEGLRRELADCEGRRHSSNGPLRFFF